MKYSEMLNACKKIRSSNAEKKIVVVGDYFLDKYIYMKDSNTGISLYTGKPAYMIQKTRTSPGAAGTVAKNLANLGIGTVYAVGYRGNDGDGFTLERDLRKLGINTDKLFVLEHFNTPSYTMIMRDSGKGYIEDSEASVQNFQRTGINEECRLISAIDELIESNPPDAIIFLDQLDSEDCGVVTHHIRQHITHLKDKHPDLLIYIDSRIHIADVDNRAIRKCNENEFTKAFSVCKRQLPAACTELSRYSSAPVIVTLGEAGTIMGIGGKLFWTSALRQQREIDSRGAGDAFTSGYISAKLADISEEDSLTFGNIVASCCVTQIATTGHISIDDVRSLLEQNAMIKER